MDAMLEYWWYIIPVAALVTIFKLLFSRNKTKQIKTELQDIFDLLEPVALISRDFTVLRCNELYASTINEPIRSVVHSNYAKLFEKDFHRRSMLAKAFLKRETQFLGHEKIENDGHQVIYETYFHPIFVGETVEQVMEIKKDVTSFYLTQQELEKQKDRFKQSAQELTEKNSELLAAQREIQINLELRDHEQAMAREIQQGLLPKSIPDLPGVDFWSLYEPFDLVGGDLYDIVKLSDYKIGIFIADVSGHGLPAALVGALAKMSLAAHAKSIHSPVELFNVMNEDLRDQLCSGYYLTGFYGVLDLDTNVFQYVRASHPYPLLYSKNREVMTLDSKGLFLGLFENPEYQQDTVQLSEGDKVVFFTDGCYSVSKSNAIAYKQYVKIIEETIHFPIDELYHEVNRKLRDQVTDWHVDDDRTFLVMEIKKKSRAERFTYLNHFIEGDHIRRIRISTKEELDQFLQDVIKDLHELNYKATTISNIISATMEVVINAFEHAHNGDTSMKATIAFSISKEIFKLSVSDKGPGFDYSKIVRSDNIDSEVKVYGLLLVQFYMDHVYFDRKGTTVTILKKNN
ncbi:MAG: SpoIIE family protein phosphatase [Fibrobacterales bacterium]